MPAIRQDWLGFCLLYVFQLLCCCILFFYFVIGHVSNDKNIYTYKKIDIFNIELLD